MMELKKSLIYSIWVVLLLFFAVRVNAQQKAPYLLHGRIFDAATGQGIAQANIHLLHEHSFTRSQQDGHFSIALKGESDSLIVELLGYQDFQLKVDASTGFLNIPLRVNPLALNEVVVNTGYQQVPANELTGSVAQISEQTLQQQNSPNILDRLDGVTSGLTFSKGKSNGNPQNKTNIVIRGLSTINGPLDPLIVVDGFIYEGDIQNINPEEVKSVTVLKDATAASIWGARAGNGVIVITTKKGQLGQDMQVSLAANYAISPQADLKQFAQMSSSDYIDVEQQLFRSGYFDRQIRSQPYLALTPAVSIFQQTKQGLLSSADSALKINQLKQIDSRNSYANAFYTSPTTQQLQLSIRGGGKKNTYLFSVADNHQLGNNFEQYQKLNLHADQELHWSDRLQANWGVYFTQSVAKSGRPSFNSLSINNRKPTYLSFQDAAGNEIPLEYQYSSAYTDTTGAGHLLDWKYYPLQEYQHHYNQVKLQELYATGGIQYQLTDFLKANLDYQYQYQQSMSRNLADAESYQARNLVNTYSQLNRTTGVVSYAIPPGGILGTEDQQTHSFTGRFQLNLNKAWGKNSVMAMSGAEVRQVKQQGQGNFYYGYQSDPLTYTQIDYVNRYRNWVTGGSQTIGSTLNLQETVNRFISYYANASYRYDQRYTIYGSIRRDGSNIFGAETNDRWKPLWSAGASWNLANEKFYHWKAVPQLKWSATWGYSGNVDLSRSALPVASYATNRYNQLPFVRVVNINNPDLRWEQIRQLNLKMDFVTKGNFLRGTLEYYTKKGTDLYGDSPFDYTAWGRSDRIVRNVANMKGKGIDLELTANWLKNTLNWETTLLFNHTQTKVTAYYSSDASSRYNLLGDGHRITPVIGYPLYAVAAYRWGGLDAQGNPQGYLDGEKSIDYNALRKAVQDNGFTGGNAVYFGSADPTYFGSLINSFSWKKWTMSVNVGFKLNYYLLKPSISYSSLVSNGLSQPEFAQRWQQAGDEQLTAVPSFSYPVNQNRDIFYQESEVNVIKGDHIRLNYVNLAYTLQFQSFKKKCNAQIYVNLANLGILWRANHYGVDPDSPGGLSEQAVYSLGFRTNFK